MLARCRLVATALVTAASLTRCGDARHRDGDRAALAATTRSGDGTATQPRAAPGRSRPSPLRRVGDELLVRFRRSAPDASRAAVHRALGTRVVREYRTVRGLQHVKLPKGTSLRDALEAFRRDPDVLYAEPNWILTAAAMPNDPLFSEQWALHNVGPYGVVDADIDAPEAWDLTTGGRDAVVAVIDTGIDFTHPDLAPNLHRNAADCDGDGVDDDGNGYADDCHGIDVANGDSDPMDDVGHGTHVAGIIGASGDDALGIAGVSWAASLVACKFLDANGEGDTAGAVACLDYVAAMKDRGVDVVATNDSWGGGLYSQALADAIDAQRLRGILFVTSAGNYGENDDWSLAYPCAYPAPNVVCVAASDPADDLASFSSWGPHTVHLAAPGAGILSTVPGGWAYADGTSMAAPHVTGTVALVHALLPGADWRSIRNRILAGGDVVTGIDMGQTVTQRRLNARGALACTSSVVDRRLRPVRSNLTIAIGTPIELAVLDIDCALPNGEPVISVLPGQPVTLRDDGLGADVEAGDGVYSGVWTPAQGGTYELRFPGDDVVWVDVDPDLQPGFPRTAWHDAGTWHGGPVVLTLVGDLDGDPTLEILASGIAQGPLYAFDADGRDVPGWPVLEGGAGVAYPALGKLAAAPGQQVVATYYADGASFAYDGSGGVLPGWPVDPESSSGRPPLVVDVDGDGLGEIFRTTSALRADGSPLNAGSGPATGSSPPAAADLFGDGQIELVFAAQGQLFVMRPDGTLVSRFPSAALDMYPATYPVVGDVDGDGAPEIVVVVRDVSSAAAVHVYSASGALERAFTLSGRGDHGTAPALADLDGDGVPEIVVQIENALEVVRGDGTSLPGWPVPLDGWQGESAPMVGDVDGDGRPDVVFTTQFLGSSTIGFVHVYGPTGVSHPRFPKQLPIGAGAAPAIADVDLDGRNEIIVGGEFWEGFPGFYDRVWVYDLGGGPHGPVLWGQFMGNAQHTGTAVVSAAAPRTFFTLGVATSGGGAVSSVPLGIDCGTRCAGRFASGTSVALTATPAAGQRFDRWGGACEGTAPSCTVLVDADKSVSAEFATIVYTVTVSRIGTGSGTVTSAPGGIDCGVACSAEFAPQSVTLTATPASGSTFAGWSGACSGTATTCVVSTSAPRAVTARFDLERHPLTVSRIGTGTGTVTSSPAGVACGATCSASFDHGTTVTLTAAADTGSTFRGWSGACSGTDPSCTVSVDGATAVTAEFARLRATVSVVRTGGGTGTVTSSPAGIACGASCAATFDLGTAVTLTAAPAAGSAFAGWSGACSGQNATCQLSASADRSVTAAFDPAPAGGGGGGCGCGAGGGSSIPAALLVVAALAFAPRRRTARPR